MSEVTELVDAQIAAYRARDLQLFLGFYGPEAKIKGFDGTVLAEGREAMRAQYDQLFSNSPELGVDIASRMVVGDYVIDEEHVSGVGLPGFPATMHAVMVYRVHDGQIQEVTTLS